MLSEGQEENQPAALPAEFLFQAGRRAVWETSRTSVTTKCCANKEGEGEKKCRWQGGRPGSTGPEAHPRESPWGRGPAGKELRGRGRGSKASTGAGAAGSPRVREG